MEMLTNSSKKVTKQPKKQVGSRGFIQNQKTRLTAFLARRTHRTLRLSRRAEYVRPLELPGNVSFTAEVTKTLWQYKKTFGLLALTYAVLYGVLVGIQSQYNYSLISATLQDSAGEFFSGRWGVIEQAGLLLMSVTTLGLNGEMTDVQQFFLGLTFLLMWLTTVWLLRNLLAGNKVKLRDGLYNSSAPLFSTILITLLIALQLLPIGLATVLYTAAETGGLLQGGAPTMLFWIGASLLGLLSAYWITSSLFALIIVTLPGMYPYEAIKTAGDMVLGRRIKILLRWLWMAAVVGVASFVVVLPIILLDMGIKHLWPALEWLPLVPYTVLAVSTIAAIWMVSYVYLLYRKVIEYEPSK